ncbi:hypothetical protein GTA51_20430, partial [Desulfovibrio aerotolerans]
GSGENFLESTLRYSKKSGVDISRVQSFDANRDMTCRLAYCVFATIAYNFIHKNSALKADRFAFTLYPGGGFLLNEALSDEKLRSIFADNRFARVITTQAPTYRYLIENGLCDPGKIKHIYGGIIPFCYDKDGLDRAVGSRRDDRRQLNICFMAQRYSPTGIEKGYDVFAAIVRALGNRQDIAFHVVGGFDRET